MQAIRDTFLETSRASHQLLESGEVARHWQDPSALKQWAVSGLAGHLARAALAVETYLDAPEPDEKLVSPATYYTVAVEGDDDLNSELHRGIRARGDETAAAGHDDLIEKHDACIQRLVLRLPQESDDRKVRVWKDMALVLDDYLITRILEMVVHIDDLAVSVNVEPPAIPQRATDLTIATLIDIARLKHGDQAVVRALTRRERDTINALRVF
jgi:Mycothiol maleylpyruvate isomerase N-terminal domain